MPEESKIAKMVVILENQDIEQYRFYGDDESLEKQTSEHMKKMNEKRRDEIVCAIVFFQHIQKYRKTYRITIYGDDAKINTEFLNKESEI